MICFISFGGTEIAILLVAYFVLLTVTFYRVMNQNSSALIKITKAALMLFIPFIGIALIWAEILIRTIISRKRSV